MQAEFLVFQAKSFYNAYLNLERIDMQSGDFLFTVPMLVNGAFSIELSLKAILTQNSISYKKEHNLMVLFRMLPEEFQCEVIGYLIEKAPEYKDMEKFTKNLFLFQMHSLIADMLLKELFHPLTFVSCCLGKCFNQKFTCAL